MDEYTPLVWPEATSAQRDPDAIGLDAQSLDDTVGATIKRAVKPELLHDSEREIVIAGGALVTPPIGWIIGGRPLLVTLLLPLLVALLPPRWTA